MQATEAWPQCEAVRDAVRSRSWAQLLAAVRGGPFMGLQRALDVVGSPVLPEATGIDDYCPLGPGAVAGLKRLYRVFEAECVGKSDAVVQQLAQPFLRRCRDELNAGLADNPCTQRALGRWTLQDAEHWLCECNKYCRTVLREGPATSRLPARRGIGTMLGGPGGDTREHPR